MPHLKAIVFLYAFEESVDCALLSSFRDDSNLHISLLKYVLYLNKDWGFVILREIDFLLKICWSIPCLHPSWKVHNWTHTTYMSSKKEAALGLPQLGTRFLADSNRWNVIGKALDCEVDAQENWDRWFLTIFLYSLAHFFSWVIKNQISSIQIF